MKTKILKHVLTASLAALAVCANTAPVFAESQYGFTITYGDDIDKQKSNEMSDQEFDNRCKQILASLHLDGKTWKQKADAITDYVSYTYGYDVHYSYAKPMLQHGGGDCWAASSLISELGKRAGFAGTTRDASISKWSGGRGHRDALLQDPDGNVYECEGSWDHRHWSSEQIGTVNKLAYTLQPYQVYQATDASKTKFTRSKALFDQHSIGVIYSFHNTEIQIPTDPTITNLGFDTETIVKNHNSDPDQSMKIEKDNKGRWLVVPTIDQTETYDDPFELCDVLKTVRIGANIVNISNTSFTGAYNQGKRSFKFVIDPANPVYASTADGGVVLKVTNSQGKAGTKLYTPATNTPAPTSKPTNKPATQPTSKPAGEQTVVMYRAYNPYSGEHFYTSNKSEFNHLVSLGWRNEGTGWIAPAKSNTPVYRLYNKYGGEHHYTTNIKERNNLIKAGWKNEGIGWYSDDKKRTPLYREYNPNAFSNNHNYTTNKSENNHLVSLGWKYEGIGWYGVRAK